MTGSQEISICKETDKIKRSGQGRSIKYAAGETKSNQKNCCLAGRQFLYGANKVESYVETGQKRLKPHNFKVEPCQAGMKS